MSISVGISEYKIAKAPQSLATYGLGACVAIAIYDLSAGQAALAHSLLPNPTEGIMQYLGTAKFTSSAVDLMIEELLKNGCTPTGLMAKLAGGASIFNERYHSARRDMGARNIAAARASLERHGIPIIAEDIGGDYGRSIEFIVCTGVMKVRSVKNGEKAI